MPPGAGSPATQRNLLLSGPVLPCGPGGDVAAEFHARLRPRKTRPLRPRRRGLAAGEAEGPGAAPGRALAVAIHEHAVALEEWAIADDRPGAARAVVEAARARRDAAFERVARATEALNALERLVTEH